MRVFVAGASGAVGRRLVPLLVESGHEVVGMTRSPGKVSMLRALGAEPVVADGLDRDAVVDAVARARPDAVVHEMTDLKNLDLRRFAASFESTNKLRTQGTANLLAGARAGGARRFVAQSYAGWPHAREGAWIKHEGDRLDPRPLEEVRAALEAIRELESLVLGAEGIEGIVLRYGGLYGPGTSLEPGGEHYEAVRKRRFPVVGSGAGVWSFLHVDDAASVTLAALERGAPGIYNIVDDEPARVSEWLPALAETIGAKPPRRVPAWVGRLALGEHGVAMMTEIRGASNAKARRELGWTPHYASWRDGFKTLVADEEVRKAA